MLKYYKSVIAASAIWASSKLLNDVEITEGIFGYANECLKECTGNMIIMLQEAPNGSLQAVRNKFSTTEFMEVGQITISN